MKNSIIKTIFITLFSLIALIFICYFAFSLFCPKVLGKFFDNLGNYNLSMVNYERQYEKSKSDEDLTELVIKCDEKNDSIRSEKYIKILIESENFNEICNSLDKSSNIITTKEFISGKYATALIFNEKLEDAFLFCDNFVAENGYSKFNPYRIIIGNYKDKLSLSEKTNLIEKLQGFYNNSENDIEKQTINLDKNILNNEN